MTQWRLHVLLALVCAGTAAAVLPSDGPARYAVPPALALALLVSRPLPAAGPIVVLLANVLALRLGVPTESPASLPAMVVVVYLAGRYAGLPGLIGPAAAVLAAWAADDFGLGSLLFAAILLGGIWGFGRLVRRRAEAARAAGIEAAQLAAQDPAVESARVVKAERERLAAETILLIRTAVSDMRTAARAAEPDLDPTHLAAVRTRGIEAVAELRRLLGLLRNEPGQPTGLVPAVTSSARRFPRSPRAGQRSRWPAPAEWVPTLAALALLPVDISQATDLALLPWLFLGVLCLVPLVQRRAPYAAALITGGLPLMSVALGIPVVGGFSVLVLVPAIAWYAGTVASWILGAGLAGWLVAQAWELIGTEPGNVPINLAIVGLPLFAGIAWREREREFVRARNETEQLLGVQDAVIAEAVAQERLHLARELHDVASHAVGVMMLQAGAAAAQRDSDPARARAALESVLAAASQATAELDTLARMLTAGAQPSASPEAGGLGDALDDLIERMRGAGLTITQALGVLPTDQRVVGAVYRTVQEALTNAARHAPGTRVAVRVDRVGDSAVVEVIDSGHPVGDGAEGSGFGLEGLAERIRALGGELSAGVRPEGGFAVRARVPDMRAVA